MRQIFVFILLLFVSLLAGGQAKPAQLPKPQASPQAQAPAQNAQQSMDAAIQAKLNQTATATINWEKSTTQSAKAEVQLLRKDQVNGKAAMQYRLKIIRLEFFSSSILHRWSSMIERAAWRWSASAQGSSWR